MSISAFLTAELDRKVNAMSSDAARIQFLALQGNSWAERYRHFCRTGDQPFGGPHPEHGEMSAADFVILISRISALQGQIKARMAQREIA
ncbi:hypothetical protein [Bradyrhizobium sp. SZCCHNRI1073]|uniref:hypothetical protein n=1 Tax=Bradyrhizobium sp. SZCCHNRI1073 TaxID=3057280 RepID=UPI00291703DF|nr:hypothetical protein [Bradyrhizobium sp. SZCCHNRI1073]